MSDLNLRSGLPAWMRLNGIWRKVTQRPITTDELLAALERLTKNNSVSALIKSGQSDYDFAHEIEESRGVRRRFRGNATPVADGYSTGVKIVFRTIPSMPPALEDLNVEQGILDHAMPSNGLVLVTGVMGSGKSTLLAAILRRIIESGGRNVSTYEAPIEFDFDAVPNPGGPVSQSTIPEHLKSFLTATRNSTRTAPDVVLIGERFPASSTSFPSRNDCKLQPRCFPACGWSSRSVCFPCRTTADVSPCANIWPLRRKSGKRCWKRRWNV